MKDLIYYPNFESSDEDWIKFGLLYIDRLNPIIPPSGDTQRTYLYHRLHEETDLIHNHRPEYREGYLATLDAIDIVERIAANPYRYDLLTGHVNIVNIWKDKTRHVYKLFEEKFSHDWLHFCLNNGYASQTSGGLLLSEELGSLYMVVLANTIADKKGVSPITDKVKIDELSFFLKSKAPVVTKELSNASGAIQLKLPSKINEISLDKIITLRNSANFKTYLKAFHNELENFYENIEAGNDSTDFVRKYQNSLNDYNENLLSLSVSTVSFVLGAGMLIQSPQYTQTEFFKTVVVGGASFLVTSGLALKRTWKNTESKRHCRRYLTKLENL